MTSITNVTGLPRPIHAALANDTRDTTGSVFSVTELLNAPRVLYLERKHAKALSMDVADAKDIMLGQAVDEYIRRHTEPPWEAGERMFVEIEVDGEMYIISGEYDLFDHETGTLVDIKVTSEFESHSPKEEKRLQLLCYKYLMEVHGIQVNAIANALFLKNWTKRQAVFKRSGEYASHSVVMHEWHDIPDTMWVENFIKDRIRAHRDATDETLCSDSDRWIDNRYVVIKFGADRAVKNGNFDSMEAAEAFRGTLENPEEYDIQFRAGEPTRCMMYCLLADKGLCDQWLGEKE